MEDKEFAKELPKKHEDISRWYTDVIAKAELADYWLVRGFMVIRPYGYALWENMTALLDARFKATGHKNAYFPLLLPESLLVKEAQHVEGFAPQVAWVTEAGTEPLEERLAVRPTSEAIFGTMYSKWIQSWRDLPMLINQWCSVVRWEKRTLPFLRTTEFLWQEGHTAHRTEEDGVEETMRMLEVYRDFVEAELAIPVVKGRKSESEKFPGAVDTYTIEALLPDGRALQSATSHHLGQNFARAFNITFQDLDGERRHVWTTSWGLSTRTVGAVIMVHGDDSGLILPPRIAPVQVIIVPIHGKDADEPALREAVDKVSSALSPRFRVEADWSDKRPGWKFNEWEMRGVPIRLELGPRDLRARQVTLVRRDDLERKKQPVPWDGLEARVAAELEAVQGALFQRALQFRAANTRRVTSGEEFRRVMEGPRGFILADWCGDAACEARIKDETGATVRCLPLDTEAAKGPCTWCGRPGQAQALFARAY
ncbi:MAG: proline--tRNA ligase [Chloroflexi bacterium]|nr:proline--tRNA ligase [Chloroflexota bacterium]